MGLLVQTLGIDAVLGKLQGGYWQIPTFQREYIWKPSQVKNLVNSILCGYPIGIITTWDQPQNHPYTPGQPLTLKGPSLYKNYTNNPAVIKLVLDGKQRLTTLAMVFDGFKSNGGKYDGEWFLDIDAYIRRIDIDIVQYLPSSKISSLGLNTVTTCIAKKMIPFKDFKNLIGTYITSVHNSSTYPNNLLPPLDERNTLATALTNIQKAYASFMIPYAEIENTISLGSVCEIFNVLNTTGTRVSTFDLLHNILFSASGKKSFLLRNEFTNCHQTYPYFGPLCDEEREEYFCQLVTGCYCAIGGKDNSGKSITSIKGADLINTPYPFYYQLCSNMPLLDAFAQDFFQNILGINDAVQLSELPYPASSIIYFGLRWKIAQGAALYSIQELDALYKAFFYRNVLTNRYDQGFLTQFGKDLLEIDRILTANHGYFGSGSWTAGCNGDLNAMFVGNYTAKTVPDIIATLTTGVNGALKQLYTLFLKSRVLHDIVSNAPLSNWNGSMASAQVQLHHLFPKAWCSDNHGRYDVVNRYGEDCFANFCPLTAVSNNSWKASSPATAILNLEISYLNNGASLNEAFIDQTSFQYLAVDDVEKFWDRRADAMANAIYNLQLVR